MRKHFLAAGLAVMIAGVSINAQDNKHWDDSPRIEGSGNKVTKDVAVQPFDELDISGVFSVVLTQGNSESVKIEADDNLQELFEVKNEGSKLKIGMREKTNFNSKTKMKVYISFKKLKSLDLKTVGNVSSEQMLSFDKLKLGNKSVGDVNLKISAQDVEIENKSVGSVKLQGKAENAVIRSNSVGSIVAPDFLVQTMDIDNTGVGSAEVNAAKELKVKDSFLGKVTNRGAATAKKMNNVRI